MCGFLELTKFVLPNCSQSPVSTVCLLKLFRLKYIHKYRVYNEWQSFIINTLTLNYLESSNHLNVTPITQLWLIENLSSRRHVVRNVLFQVFGNVLKVSLTACIEGWMYNLLLSTTLFNTTYNCFTFTHQYKFAVVLSYQILGRQNGLLKRN